MFTCRFALPSHRALLVCLTNAIYLPAFLSVYLSVFLPVFSCPCPIREVNESSNPSSTNANCLIKKWMQPRKNHFLVQWWRTNGSVCLKKAETTAFLLSVSRQPIYALSKPDSLNAWRKYITIVSFKYKCKNLFTYFSF